MTSLNVAHQLCSWAPHTVMPLVPTEVCRIPPSVPWQVQLLLLAAISAFVAPGKDTLFVVNQIV